jgi:hypothetical protein
MRHFAPYRLDGDDTAPAFFSGDVARARERMAGQWTAERAK